MIQHRLPAALAVAAALLSLFALSAGAQQAPAQGQNWFIPAAPHAAAARRPPARGQGGAQGGARGAAPTAAQVPALADTAPTEQALQAAAPQQIQVQLPPAPPVPDAPHGTLPPAAVLGVLSVPDVLRASVAYQAADKLIGQRRQKLNDDAQAEQVKLRDLGQQLANGRARMTPEQIRTKEKELQDRIAESRRSFTERNRIIQEQGQYALLQIQRTLSEVVQKVAASRGMNLVLQRAEVAVNIPEFDITPEVTEMLNKALASVVIPPDGVSPVSTGPVAAAASPTKAAAAAPKRP